MMNNPERENEILLYQTEDGKTRIDVKMLGETVWLTQAQMGELFQKSKQTISEHIQNIFQEGELNEDSVVRDFRTRFLYEKKHLIPGYREVKKGLEYVRSLDI